MILTSGLSIKRTVIESEGSCKASPNTSNPQTRLAIVPGDRTVTVFISLFTIQLTYIFENKKGKLNKPITATPLPSTHYPLPFTHNPLPHYSLLYPCSSYNICKHARGSYFSTSTRTLYYQRLLHVAISI